VRYDRSGKQRRMEPRDAGLDTGSPAQERQTRELSILNAVAEALNSAPDVRQALQLTLELVVEVLGLRTAWVWLRDPETGHFYGAAAHNLPPYLQEPVRMTGRPCWCIQAFKAGKLTPKNIAVLECSRLYPARHAGEEELTAGLSGHASIPLYFRETPLGIMNLGSESWRTLTSDELRLLSTIGYQVGIAIERARLAEAGTQLARIEERTRIAREIHDTLAQGLTGIALNIEGAMRYLEDDPKRARQRLELALAASRESLEEARRSVLDLRDGALGKPVREALAALARAFTSETGIRVRIRSRGAVSLPERVEAEFYRIAQEALTNVRRHAHASDVELELRTHGGDAILSIRDNGQGFEPRELGEGHHGVLGMKERARLLGGRLRLKSQPGGPTTVTVVAPLPDGDA
jgi:two-component system NarL family sensor kinase